MSLIHLGLPYVPPPPPVGSGQWTPLQHTWIGADGSEWDLTRWDDGIFLLASQVRGLLDPTHSTWTTESPALHGDRILGTRVTTRECHWPIHLYSDAGSPEWVALDRAWWRSLDRDRSGTWRVEAPGSVRELRCHLAEVEDSLPRDPVRAGWATYSIRLVAHDPWWHGPWVTRRLDNAPTGTAPAPYHGADPQAPRDGAVYRITSASQLGTATIDNPGDELAHLVYLVDGPFTAASVGLPGAVTSAAVAVPEGRSLLVDTRPQRRHTVAEVDTPSLGLEDGNRLEAALAAPATSRWSALSSVALGRSVPPGEAIDLDLSMTGTGRVTVGLRPAYRRAW